MFVVIDGSALMCVAYYGNLPDAVKYAKTDEEKEAAYKYIEQNSNGIYTNGIKSFLHTLLNILDEQNPTHLAICFDESRESTFRRQLYPEYKGQRPKSPEPLSKQMQNIRTLLKASKVPVLLSKEYEADDYAGSLCKTFERTMPVRFLTKDRDYLQLISPWTKGWMMTSNEAKWTELCEKYGYPEKGDVPFGCYEFNELVVEGEYGIKPNQIADWKGISGDSSDNIPGIKGIADKSAIPLLAHYGTLENIQQSISDAEEMGTIEQLKNFWKEKLDIKRPPITLFQEGKDQGALCKNLATIKTDLDVGSLDQYEVNIDLEMMKKLATRLELDDIVARIDAHLGIYQDLEEEREVC